MKNPSAAAPVRELLARYGLADAPLKPIAGGGGRIWRIGDKALRICPQGTSLQSAETEVRWLQAPSGSNRTAQTTRADGHCCRVRALVR